MEQQYYTKEELELLNTPSTSEALPPQPVHAVPETNAEMIDITSAQQDINIPQRAGAVASSIFLIVFGLVFMLVPLSMGVTMAFAMKATGDLDGGYWLVPLGMVSIFVFVGGAVVVKGIMQLVKRCKK